MEGETFWNDVFDILIRECGAREEDRLYFTDYCRSHNGRIEFRFSGALGFGGKLRRSDARIYVDCYPEDETEGRQRMMTRTNEQLKALIRP